MGKFFFNTEYILLFFGIFSFLFFWDIKVDSFQLRFLILLPLIYLFKYSFKNLTNKLFLLSIPLLIFTHLLVVTYLENFSLIKRDYFGLIFLFFIFLIIAIYIKDIPNIIKKSINYFTILFSILYILYFFFSESKLVIDCYNGWFFQTEFIFVENSHFSIISVPIISFYTVFFANLKKFFLKEKILFIFFIIFLTISYLNFSTTFLVGNILMQIFLLVVNLKNKKIIIISILIISFSTFFLTSNKQCTERSVGSIIPMSQILIYKSIKPNTFYPSPNVDEPNKIKGKNIKLSMSVETFIVSLEISLKSLFNNPLGFGFNKYYLAHEKFIDGIFLTNVHVSKNNKYDGSTNISKIITEFGVFGVSILLFFILNVFVKIFKQHKFSDIEVFVIALIGLQFLRGVGYFNGGFILIFTLYFFIFYKNNFLKNEN